MSEARPRIISGKELLRLLVEAGVVEPCCQRAVITASLDEVVQVLQVYVGDERLLTVFKKATQGE